MLLLQVYILRRAPALYREWKMSSSSSRSRERDAARWLMRFQVAGQWCLKRASTHTHTRIQHFYFFFFFFNVGNRPTITMQLTTTSTRANRSTRMPPVLLPYITADLYLYSTETDRRSRLCFYFFISFSSHANYRRREMSSSYRRSILTFVMELCWRHRRGASLWI